MTRPRRPSERDTIIEQTIEMANDMARDHRQVMDALAQWANGIGAGQGGRRPIGSHSDPTQSTALAPMMDRGQPDHAYTDRIDVDQHLTEALKAWRNIDHVRRIVMAGVNQEIPKEPEARGVVHCANLNCPDDAWATKAGRCDPCYQYRRLNDRDRRKSAEPKYDHEVE